MSNKSNTYLSHNGKNECKSGFVCTPVASASCQICKVNQNRVYTPYMTVYFVIFLPKIPYIYRIFMVLANPTDMNNKSNTYFFPTMVRMSAKVVLSYGPAATGATLSAASANVFDSQLRSLLSSPLQILVVQLTALLLANSSFCQNPIFCCTAS